LVVHADSHQPSRTFHSLANCATELCYLLYGGVDVLHSKIDERSIGGTAGIQTDGKLRVLDMRAFWRAIEFPVEQRTIKSLSALDVSNLQSEITQLYRH